jgi:hypothetical protein
MWFSYTPVLTLWLTCLHAVLIYIMPTDILLLSVMHDIHLFVGVSERNK